MSRAVLALLLATGCAAAPTGWEDAAGATRDPDLARLCVDLWEESLRVDPVWAGFLGDERYLGELPISTPHERQRRRAHLKDLGARLAAIDVAGLSASERITREMALAHVDESLVRLRADRARWNVNPRRAPHTRLFNLAPDQPTATALQRSQLVERWNRMAAYIDQAAADLRRGLEDGLVANHTSVARTVEQLERILEQDPAEWPLARPDLPIGLPDVERRTLLQRVDSILRDEIRPALARYHQLLVDHVLPRARSDEMPGLASLPGGLELYRELIAVHTSLPLTPEEIHRTGLDAVASVRAEMEDLGESLFGRRDLSAVRRRIDEDAALRFSTRDEVESMARDSLARARDAMGRWFGRLPQAPCVIERIGAHEERETTIAYYRGPSADGGMPGRYFINTYAPETRPRIQAEVLAYHEAIPGHHLQIAIAQELDGVPLFQRHMGSTAFVEGWALYTERLSDEMGLYTGDLDRLGMLSFDAWRACRLVVDTGLHAFGWSRERAIQYMRENTLLEDGNIENEVDRYIATPGQALAYKTGQREIVRLRRDAEERLGPRFDVRAFHDVVLGSGAVTLGILERNVDEWVAATAP